jgi:hypothetical protein
MRAATWPETIAELVKVLLIDVFQQVRNRTLRELVLESGKSERTKLPIAFGYPLADDRLRFVFPGD